MEFMGRGERLKRWNRFKKKYKRVEAKNLLFILCSVDPTISFTKFHSRRDQDPYRNGGLNLCL